MENVENLRKLLGRPVVSVETANELGHVNDVLADPLTGRLAGFSVKRLDESSALVSVIDVHGIGPDAIMVERDESLVLIDASPINTIPRMKADLIGVKVMTKRGHLLGNISDASLCLLREPVFIYEVRSSIFDKLLGHAFYFAASLGCAFAADRSALVVSDDSSVMEHSLEAAAKRLLGSVEIQLHDPTAIRVEIRSQPS